MARRRDVGRPSRFGRSLLVARPRGVEEVADGPAQPDDLGRPEERAQAGPRPARRHPPRHAGQDRRRAARRGPGHARAPEGRGRQARRRDRGDGPGRRHGLRAQARREDGRREAQGSRDERPPAERVVRRPARPRVEDFVQGLRADHDRGPGGAPGRRDDPQPRRRPRGRRARHPAAGHRPHRRRDPRRGRPEPRQGDHRHDGPPRAEARGRPRRSVPLHGRAPARRTAARCPRISRSSRASTRTPTPARALPSGTS